MDTISPNSSLSPIWILGIVGSYFILLLFIAWRTSRGASNQDFFVANKQAPWYLVAFGMIGASLSGVTFISIPGVVGAAYLDPSKAGAANLQFSYMQVVFGYLAGYAVIALILLPLYYRLKLTSIYTYLGQRFGNVSYKTGASFFLISRIIGAAFRLYLVAMVLYSFVFSAWGIPFWMVALLTIILIWIYTFQGGIKTIVWTDTLQTAFMLLALVFSISELLNATGFSLTQSWANMQQNDLGQIFFFEGGWSDPNNFFKQFISGMFIAIVMTGLDQDMMQKNLTCRTLADAQKNMGSFSLILVVVNFAFLFLGALLAMYALQLDITVASADQLYPTIALQYLPTAVGVFFIIGLVAAAYSSADSALTALTTSFCIDFLGFKTTTAPSDSNTNSSTNPTTLDDDLATTANNIHHESTIDADLAKQQQRTRYQVHVGFSLVLLLVIVLFWLINDRSVINSLFTLAGYTYGPLLGLYSFGLFSARKVADRWVPLVCLAAPVLTYLIGHYAPVLFWGYKFGFELLLVNGLLTSLGLWLISRKETVVTT